MGDYQQKYELVLPKNVVEKCFFLKAGDGAKFLSTNYQKKIFSQLKLFKQSDGSIRIGVEVTQLKTIHRHQPEFVCIEGATKDFLGSYSAPDEFIESKNQDKEILNRLEEDDQEKSHQELIREINKTLKSVDELDKLGASDSEAEELVPDDDGNASVLVEKVQHDTFKDTEETIIIEHETHLIISPEIGPEVLTGQIHKVHSSPANNSLKHTSPKLQTDIAVGKVLEADSCSSAFDTIKTRELSTPIDTDITCEIILPKSETLVKPSAKETPVSTATLNRNRQQGSSPVNRGKRKLNLQLESEETAPDRKLNYKREKNVPCPSCEIMLKDYDSVYDHLRNTHKLDDDFEKHLNDVKEMMRVKCTVCNSELCSKDQLAVHMRQLHNEGPECKCPHCDSTFKTVDYLKSHIKRVHLNKEQDKKFLCHLCPASFRYKSYLTSHVKLVHSENPKDSYRCDQCDHTCSHEKYLKNHISRVHGDKKYSCKYCAREFKTSANMLRHVKLVHENQDNPKPFECPECGKRFSLKANMTEHVKSTHYVEYKYHCEICKCGFRRTRQLENHKCMPQAQIVHQSETTASFIMLPCDATLSGDMSNTQNSIVIAEQVSEPEAKRLKIEESEQNVEYQYIIATPELLSSLNTNSLSNS